MSQEWNDHFRKNGIIRETTPPRTPQSNGFIERENRTIMDKVRSMLYSRSLPLRLWAEAMNTAIRILNAVTVCGQTATPFEQWHGVKPDVSHLRVFGCDAFYLVKQRRKLDKKGEKGLWVGFGKSVKIHRVFDPKTNKILVTRDVKFNEQFACGLVDDGPAIVLEQERDEGLHSQQEERDELLQANDGDGDDSGSGAPVTSAASETTTPNVRQRGRPPGSRNKPKPTPVPHSMSRRSHFASMAALGSVNDPETPDEALSSLQANDWKASMADEMASHKKSKTWELVPLPPGKNVIDNRWVFRTKRNADGSLNKYKSRLVARGFTQRKGTDYNETFAPVARYDSIRCLLANVAHRDLEMTQFDVKTAFLYGELEEELYMKQPDQFDDGSGRVCKLTKGLYGLKQSPRRWNKKFDEFLQMFGMERSEVDPCIYVCRQTGDIILLGLYVDDGLLCCSRKETMKRMLNEMKSNFEITVTDPNFFIGLEIERDRNKRTIALHQRGYIDKILERFNMSDCKPCVTPGDPHAVLTKADCRKEEEDSLQANFPYREAVGCLMFLQSCSRPDIAFNVVTAAHFSERPGKPHIQALKRIMRYLQKTKDLRIIYGNGDLDLVVYSDSDYATCTETRRCFAGRLAILNGGPVTWKSKKMDTVVLSTTEAEYMAVTEAVKDALWLRQLLSDMVCLQTSPTLILCDNTGAIDLTSSEEFHARTKHIDVRHHFIKQEIERKHIRVDFVGTKEQAADMLTKSLNGPALQVCRQMAQLVSGPDGVT